MREFRLIEEAIRKFELNLTGITVLTEAASGNYVWTPLIAALAGANVHAFSKDSNYATFDEVKKHTDELASKLFVKDRINIINELSKEIINSADIITNTGFLRPLNKEKLQNCKNGAVIPLMYETWEFRKTDIDLQYCRKKNIPVVGTNEADNRLKTIEYLGSVAKKALFLNGIEVYKSKIVILGCGKFAEAIYDSLKQETDFIEIWTNRANIGDLFELDALIIADHNTDNLYIGKNGVIDPKLLKKNNMDIKIIHIAGNVDTSSLVSNDLQFYPSVIAKPKWMSLTTDFVGPKPVIDLHTAGLKVAEGMIHAKLIGLIGKKYKNYLEMNYPATFFRNEKYS